MNPENTKLLEQSFLDDGGLEVPMIDATRLTLRGFTLGSLNACRSMNLPLFLGAEREEEAKALTPQERQDQTIAFCWAHAKPVREVNRAIRDGSWRDLVDEFAWSLPLEALPKLLTEINRISSIASAAAVDVAPRSGVSSQEEPPKN